MGSLTHMLCQEEKKSCLDHSAAAFVIILLVVKIFPKRKEKFLARPANQKKGFFFLQCDTGFFFSFFGGRSWPSSSPFPSLFRLGKLDLLRQSVFPHFPPPLLRLFSALFFWGEMHCAWAGEEEEDKTALKKAL